jgi:hypothetical protein
LAAQEAQARQVKDLQVAAEQPQVGYMAQAAVAVQVLLV